MMRLPLILILNLFTSMATAGPICPNLHRDLQSDAHLHLATIIGEENRETFQEYAKSRDLELEALQKKYAATGVFHCGGYSGTANVVHKGNRLVLSAHQFYHEKSCRKKMGGDFSSCYFETSPSDGSKPVKHKLKLNTLVLGSTCPTGFAHEDWAVVDLEKEVENVKPYRVAPIDQLGKPENGFIDLAGLNTTTIARMNDNFKDHPLETSSLCDGQIGGVQGFPSPDKSRKEFFIATNCSYGHGNSGGGVFLQSGSIPTFIGVVASGKGKDYQPFGRDSYSGAALVEGRLYKEITK